MSALRVIDGHVLSVDSAASMDIVRWCYKQIYTDD